VIVLEVSRGAVGEKSTFRQLWRRARGRIGALVGWTLLLILGVALAFGIFVGIIVALASTAAAAGIAFAVLFGIFGALGAVVLYFWLGTKLSLVPSALMIERLTLGRAIKRSWSLTGGAFWKTLGIQLLVSAIIGVVSQVISTPLNLLTPMIVGLLDPNGQNGQTLSVVLVGLTLLSLIVAVAFGAITAVVQTATTALIYLDRRIRKEGLDLELARFVEARQAGDTSIVDPLLHSAPSTGPVPTPGVPAPPSNGSPWS
jgi:MFS family permease